MNRHKRYTIEIKERNVDSIEDLETLPLKVKKYCNIMEKTKEDETPLIIYLVNNSNYYIFNLKALDLNTLNLRNWTIAMMKLELVVAEPSIIRAATSLSSLSPMATATGRKIAHHSISLQGGQRRRLVVPCQRNTGVSCHCQDRRQGTS